MTIRAIIKTSHFVQLALLLVLVACFAWLGRDLWQLNAVIAKLPAVDFLVDELERTANIKFRLALDYASPEEAQASGTRPEAGSPAPLSGETEIGMAGTPDSSHKADNESALRALQDIWLMERGLKPRPQDSLFYAGQKASLEELLAPLVVDPTEERLLERCLEKNTELNRGLEWAVMLAGGLRKDDSGHLVQSEAPQPERARDMLTSEALLTLPAEIARLHHDLRQFILHHLRTRLEHEKLTLTWAFALGGGMVFCLLCCWAVSARLIRKRVTLPLGMVGDYAETVASGGEPEPLSMKYGDELASMYGSLLKLQGVLSLRIRELKASERASQASSQQAMLAKAQALSSLNMAQKALATQEKFLAQVSREVRQPISEILGMSWQALQAGPDRKLHGWLLRINQSGGALLDIFNRILDVSGFEEDGMRQQEEAFTLVPFLELLRQSVAAAASEKGLSLSLQAGSNLPTEIAGDKRHIEETLRILLDNAVRHTSAGRVCLEVQRLADSGGNMPEGRVRLRFSVSDSGPGFSNEEQERIFASRNMSSGDSGTSLGMGLALARYLVHFMGGELQLASSPRGSTFSFEVDCTVLADVAGPLRRPLVLVVEDSEINLEIVCEVLEQLGVETMRATDGQQALDAVRDRQPDMILMDIQMPVMDGCTACRHLREQGHSRIALPIIAMTGHGDEEARAECLRAGMNAHLEKPLDVQALTAQLEQWLPGGLPDGSRQQPEDVADDAEGATGGAQGDSTMAAAPASATAAAAASMSGPAHAAASAGSDVQYIETRRGLAAVGGNTALYNELLQRFADSYGNCVAEIQAALAQNDLAAMARLVHTVKGVSANLGLARVTELCKRMEDCLPQTPPAAEDMAAFATAMQGTLAQIGELQVQRGHTAAEVARVLAREHQQGLLRLLKNLPQRLQQDWGGVEAALEAFMPLVQGTPLAGEMRALLDSVNNFDVSDAAEHAALLRRKLSGGGHEDGLLH